MFTYNLVPVTALDELRIHIGDVKAGDGPAPNRANLSDEILSYFLDAGGGVIGAVPLAFDHLAALWIARPIFGPGELSTIHVAMDRKYRQAAADWRGRFLGESASGDDLTGNDVGSGVVFTVIGADEAGPTRAEFP